MDSGYQAAVLTISDSAASGERTTDESGDCLAGLLQSAGLPVVHREVQPDEKHIIASTLRRLAAAQDIHCIFTTGGTGVGPRDVTPEATLSVIDKALPGIAEAMRAASLQKTPYAMLSRQQAGIHNRTLIVNLPGSVKAVAECFAVVQPVLKHVLDLINGNTAHD